MPYDDSQESKEPRPSPTSSESGQQSSGQSYSTGGLADQVASGAAGAAGASPSSPTSRDQAMGQPELQQQQQSAEMMMQLKEQFQGVIASLGQFTEQVNALVATFPPTQQALQPVIEQAIPQIGQIIMQSMVEAIQSVQAEPMMPSQV